MSIWLTVAEAAAYLKVDKRSLLRWTREGHIQGYALSGTKRRIWRFLQSDLDTALLAHPVLDSPASAVLSHEGRIN